VGEIRVVRAEGAPLDRGRQIGRALGDLIERSLAFYTGYWERRGVRLDQLHELLEPHFVAADAALPDEVEVIRGMAEGAMAPFWELWAANSFEELEPLFTIDLRRTPFLVSDISRVPGSRRRPSTDRCSSFTVAGPGFTLMGHNEQWLAGDRGNVAVIVDLPADGSPKVVSPTIVSCLPAVGMNEFGAAQAIQSVSAADDGPGIPRVLVSRHSIDAVDRLDAVQRAGMDGRAGGYGHVFAMREGDAFIVETTASRSSLLSGPGAHTNHYLDPALGALAPPPGQGSVARYERLIELIGEWQPEDPQGVMDILRDHHGKQSICLHPDPRDGDEAEGVLFSMVCDVEHGQMWVAEGNPCINEFEEIDLAGVL
jgi:acyl-CoA:6-aminopenicillanic acid acyl transferase